MYFGTKNSFKTVERKKKRKSSDEGLTLETSAFKLLTVANLHDQIIW